MEESVVSQCLSDAAALDAFIQSHTMCVAYFTGPDCAVCKALKPKLVELLARRFPEIAFGEVDCAASPALAASHSIFTIPTLVLFIQGKESLRRSRSFAPAALALELERPYSMLWA